MIPRLHVITDDRILARGDFPAQARTVLEAGGADLAFHLRGPDTDGRSLFRLAKALVGPARESGSLLLVNDRLDVALALGLSGAHLGQRSLPPETARRLLGANRTLGLSVHTGQEARGAGSAVDFLLVGTVFPSNSHPDRTPGGVATLLDVGNVSRLPLLGIGGITPARVRRIREAGGHGVAVLGGIWKSRDPAEAVGVFLNELEIQSDSTVGFSEAGK